MEDENKLATKNETAIDTPARRGMEEPIDNSDLIIPRVMLIQNTPPKTVTIDRKQCPPGTIINSLTAQPLPLDEKGGVFFVPVLRGKKWIRFNAQEKGKRGYVEGYELGAKIWESRDSRDPLVMKEGAWEGNEAPLATEIIEFLILVPGQGVPLVLGFSRTSFNAGKKLTSLAQFAKRGDGSSADLFERAYRLRAEEKQNDQKQQYYVLNVDLVAPVEQDSALFKEAESLYSSFRGRDIKAHGEEEPAPVPPPAARQPWE